MGGVAGDNASLRQQVACSRGQYLIEVRQLLRINRRERNADIPLAIGDDADAILLEQMLPIRLGVDALELQTHEVTGIEGIRIPQVGILRRTEHLMDDVGT